VASSSAGSPRVLLACDACAAAAAIGPRDDGGLDAWCEACQRPQVLAAGEAPRCTRCRRPLATSTPGFTGIWGELQDLDAVLSAWGGDAAPLVRLIPERPRFLTDLDPPAPRVGDAPALRELLATVARGDYAAALALAPPEDARACAAVAIASERRGDRSRAIAAWTRALALEESARARLARGALFAATGEPEAAAADLARAGDSREARWNRAALIVQRSLEAPGPLSAAGVARARAETGEAPEYWSEPTVGRLAWSLLLERLPPGPAGEADLAALRDAETLFEHDTRWDLAMQLAGYVRAGSAADAGRVAQPLARALAAGLLERTAMKGEPLADAARAVARAHDAIGAGEPGAARALLAPLVARPDLRRYRIPCAACGRGSVGVEAFAGGADDDSPAGV